MELTSQGGILDYGVLFEYDPSTNAFAKKIDFDGTAKGRNPNGSLMQASNGKLYGMTQSGGTSGLGALFEYDPSTNAFTKKIDFDGTAKGRNPFGGLLQASNGKLYGMTYQGGTSGRGVLFEYDPSTNTFTKKVDFNGAAKGSYPRGSLMQASNGKLYGMTQSGGTSGLGALFEYDPSTNAFTKKIDFDGTAKGRNPFGGLLQASNGKLYGMTNQGGSNNFGVLFEYDPSTNMFAKKLDFDGSAKGRYPNGSLMQATNGKLYGMTEFGGTSGLGVLFEYDPSTNAFIKKLDFNSTNGKLPRGNLIENIIQSRIALSGNSQNIAYNATPELSNSTDFGKLASGGTATKIYTIKNNGTADLELGKDTWEAVGVNPISPAAGSFLDMVIDKDENIYVAFRDDSQSLKLSVKKFNGLSWQYLGGSGITSTSVDYLSIILDQNQNPMVAFRDGSNGHKVSVIKFENGIWQNVGSSGFSSGQPTHINLALDESYVPYITYVDASLSFKATVKKFNGSNWVTVGSPSISSGTTTYTDITLVGSTPYLIYHLNSGYTKVKKFDGVNWVQVGATIPAVGTSNNSYHKIATDGTTPFIAYNDASSSGKMTVRKLEIGSWNLVGSKGFTTSGAYRLDIDISRSGIPYVIFADGSTSLKTTLKYFDGTNWTSLGSSVGLSVGNGEGHRVVLNDCGIPYICYSDQGQGYRANVKKFNPAVSVGGSSFSISTLPASTTLAPGASTTFDVEFNPSTSGSSQGQICINSNDPDHPTFTYEIQGSTNTAMDFDGTNDRIVVSSSSSLDLLSFSTEVWIKTSDNPTILRRIVVKETTSGENIQLYMWQNGKISFRFSSNILPSPSGVSVNSSTAINDGNWHHLAGTFDNGTKEMKIYIDGLVDAQTVGTVSPVPSSGSLYIGSYSGFSYFLGQLDEVRIWNRALCQAEIHGRMNSCLQGNENGLVAYYDFEEGVQGGDNTGLPSTAFDKAGTNHGTMNNFTKNNSASNWVNGKVLTDDGLVTGTLATWNGTTSTAWNTATNWTPNGIPDQCTDVIIPITASNPTFSNNQAVNGIEVLSGASLTVGAGGCLWVGSTFTNNGEFILNSTASSYAQYLGPQVTGTLQQVFGEAGWHSIASPFIDAKLDDIVFDNGAFLQYGAANKCNIHYYESGVHQASPPGTWNNAWGSWVCATDGNDPFDGSRAYNIYFDNKFVAGNFTTVTMSVTGTLRNMPITLQLNEANGGWNHLGNPFPSVIDWEKWSDNSAINNTYYLWDATSNTFNTYMTGGTSVPMATLTQYIAPYQSVFVRESIANAVTTNNGDEPDVFNSHFTSNADRPTTCPATINNFYKTTVTGVLYIEAKTNDQKHSDQLAIRFGNGFSPGFNADEEAVKFFSPKEEVPSIFTIIEDRAFVISSFPEPGAVVESIPLGLQTKVGQSISFVATEIPEGITAILEDKLEKTFTNLKKSYSFKSTKTLDNNRFVLHLGDEYFTKSDISGSGDLLAFINNGELKFMTNPSLDGGDVELINMSIQTLVKAKYSSETTIDVSSYPAGVYLIIVKKRGEVFRQKIVIQ